MNVKSIGSKVGRDRVVFGRVKVDAVRVRAFLSSRVHAGALMLDDTPRRLERAVVIDRQRAAIAADIISDKHELAIA